MKLRLNATLRAALIAAITAVGFTFSQAQADDGAITIALPTERGYQITDAGGNATAAGTGLGATITMIGANASLLSNTNVYVGGNNGSFDFDHGAESTEAQLTFSDDSYSLNLWGRSGRGGETVVYVLNPDNLTAGNTLASLTFSATKECDIGVGIGLAVVKSDGTSVVASEVLDSITGDKPAPGEVTLSDLQWQDGYRILALVRGGGGGGETNTISGITLTATYAGPVPLYWGLNEKSGVWDLASTKWAYGDGSKASVPFTNEMETHFTEAGGGGTITIQGEIVAQKLVVEGRIPYTFELGSGSLTVNDSVNVGGGASATFNMDLSAPAAILDEGGMLTMGEGSTFTGKTLSMKQQSVLNGPGVFAPDKLVLDVVDEGKKTKQPVVKGGAVLDTPIIEGTGVLHVKGATLRASQDTEVSNVELQVDEVSKATSRLEIQEGVAMNVGTLVLEDAVVANNGKLHAFALIVQSKEEVGMGVLTVDGLVQVDGLMLVDGAITVVMQEGAIGMLTLASENASLICENDLSLRSTSSDQDQGNLEVRGALTVTGGVELGKVTAGSLTIGESESAALTVSGQLTAGSITLQHLSKSQPCLKADSLGAGTTSFEVDPDVLKSLDVGDGDTVVLADLKNPFADAASLTINGSGFWLNVEKRVLVSIGQDEESKDIVLSATAAQYIWTNGSEDMLWGTDDNWLGSMVPDENAHALVLDAKTPWTIIMDQPGTAGNLSFLEGSETTLQGENSLTVSNTLSVENSAKVTVKDGVAVSADAIVLNGELALQQNDSVQVGAEVNRLNGRRGARLVGSAEGPADTLLIKGTGGVYAGGYDSATVHLDKGAGATLAAGEGLSLIADSGSSVVLTYTGATKVDTIQAAHMNLTLNGPGEDNSKSPLTISQDASITNSVIVTGLSAKDTALTLGTGNAVVLDATSLNLDGATVQIYQTETDAHAMTLRDVAERKGVKLVRFGADDSSTDKVQLNGVLFNKYYENARLENGWILVDLKDIHFSGISKAYTYNGRAGSRMLSDAFDQLNPQVMNPEGDIAAVMDALETQEIPENDQDRVAAAMAGASYAAMGSAFSKDVERQLRSIRNRTTSMGCAECVVNENMPYVNAWVNAEGEFRKMNRENTLAGYTLNSWGATLGVDVDFTPRFTAGVAFTYLQGDFTSRSADMGDGDLDRMYVSAFARYARRAWTHTFVATFGSADASLDRTVDYGAGRYSTKGDTDGTAFGFMYEAGYTVALSEDASTCLQPVFNVLYRHSSLGGYTETGSDAALKYADAEADVVTFGLGTRLQSAVGTSAFNRHTLLETRALLKLDAGDRDVTPQANFVGVGGMQKIKSSEYGAFGVEIGAGVMIPVGEGSSSLFFDVSAEFRSGYSDVNGAAGYRVNF